MAITTSRYAVWPRTPAASGDPRASERLASTPCHSGVTHATGRRKAGSWSTGKNVPENRNSGVTTKRYRMLKPPSVSCVAVNAKIGTAKAIPVRTVIGRASITHHELNDPNSAATPMKMAVAPVTCIAT